MVMVILFRSLFYLMAVIDQDKWLSVLLVSSVLTSEGMCTCLFGRSFLPSTI
jgi:hypothetical protein